VNNGPTGATDPSGLEVRIYRRSVSSGSGNGHARIIVFDPATKIGYTYDGSGPGSIGSIGGEWDLTPKERGPKTFRVVPPVVDGSTGIKVNTGLTYNEEIAIFKRVYAQLYQVPKYSAIFGPNSNTYAHQLLKLVAKEGGFAAPDAPPWAVGWDYNGPWRYGGEFFDQFGTPTDLYNKMKETRGLYADGTNGFGQVIHARP